MERQKSLKLIDQINIGKQLAIQLETIGIKNYLELQSNGTKKTFIQLRKRFPDSCLNKLYAIEGAIRQIRRHNLSNDIKLELRIFFDDLNNGN